MSSMRLRFVPLVLLVGLLAAMPLALGGNTTAQGSGPDGEYTPAFPDGPPVKIQPVSTVPPETPAGVPTSEPDPNQPPPTDEPNPNQPPPNQPPPPAPDIPPVPTPTLTPIFPVEEPDAPPSIEVMPGRDLPSRLPPDLSITPPAGISPVLGPATITIRTRVCDNEGFNPYTSYDLAAMTAECPVATGMFGFSMSHPGLALSKTSFGGMVTFSVPPLTTATIQSAARDDYDKPVHVCQSAEKYDVWGQRQLTWKTSPGEKVECTWFFVQNNDDINLVLDKWMCTWFDPATFSKDTVACGYESGTWGDVRLSDSDPATADIVRLAGTLPTGTLEFLDLPPGTYTVTETNVTTGTAWTFLGNCWLRDAGDSIYPSWFPLVKDIPFTLTLDQVGDTVSCNSVNVLEKSSSAGTSVPLATIKVKTAVCDNQGWDPYIWRPSSLAAYQAECINPDPGFVFTVSQSGGAVQTRSTAGGEITFTVAGPGHAMLVQTLPSGYSTPVIFCADSLAPTVVPSPYLRSLVDLFPEAGAVYTCTFFNVLETTDMNLVIQGHTCPAAYDIDDPWGWGGMPNPMDACDSLPGLHGTVALKDSDPTTADQSVSSDGPPAVFLDLAPGTYTLTLTPKGSMSSSFLFRCTTFPFTKEWVSTLTPIGKGPTVSIPLTHAGKTVFCDWYVVPKPVTSSGTFSLPLPLLGAAGTNATHRRHCHNPLVT